MNSLQGKWILVTGATSGIGNACAASLIQAGAKVVALGRSVDSLSFDNEQQVLKIKADLAQIDTIESIFETLKQQDIKLDGLVHAAGQTMDVTASQFSYDEALQLFDVNFFAFCELMKFCSKKKFMNDDASVVVISSMAVPVGGKAQGTYAASKAALEAYMRIMAKELLPKKIRLNAVRPSVVGTKMAEESFNRIEGFLERSLEQQPLGIIEPSSLADVVQFLLSDQSKFITGSILNIDAGYTCTGV